MADPAVEAAVEEVLRASKETGVAEGYVTNNPVEAAERAAQGFRFVNPGHDLRVLSMAFREMAAGR